MVGWRAVVHGVLALCVVGLAGAAEGAPPSLPETLTYQGVLLDDQGVPRTGSVDLTLRIYDAIVGGTLLYVQTLATVPLTDGVFTVALGPSGAATDTPSDPLTTSLTDALAGDLAATGPSRFLEVTVGLDGPLARTQILSVPYALRAESAASADSAVVAQTATDSSSLGGLSSIVFTEIYEHTNLDGSGPPNADPSEGTADVDGDGIANFVDPDNDDDGLTDTEEVAQGTDINLVTPVLTSATPSGGFAILSHVVSVEGSNFEPGMAVVFGTETPVPTNLTATSFDVVIGPAVPGAVDLEVTRSNGEQDLLAGAFTFLTSINHGRGSPDTFDLKQSGVTLLGNGSTYAVDLDANGIPETTFVWSGAVAFDAAGNVVGYRCVDVGGGNCEIRYFVDSDGDGELADETGVFVESPGGLSPFLQLARMTFDPSGNPVLGYIRQGTGGRLPIAAHDRDGDGTFGGAAEVGGPESTTINQGGLVDVAVDGSSRIALLYYNARLDELRVGWDRSGDGDLDDAPGGDPELVTIASLATTPGCIGVGFSPGGELAVAYDDGSSGLVLGRDQNGDGDFADAGETVVLDASATGDCAVASGDGNPLAIAYEASGNTIRLLIDRNDDRDFADADENLLLLNASTNEIAVAYDDTGRAYVATNVSILPDPTP